MVNQVRRAFVHAPAQATGTKPAAFATEGNRVPFTAVFAIHLSESIGEDAAGKELLRLLRYNPGQTIAGIGVRPHPLEAGQVLPEYLVERGLFGLTAGIGLAGN